MKKRVFYVFIAILFASCKQKVTLYENRTPEEQWAIIQAFYMVPGTSADTERPLPNVLSEREVLLKAAYFAIAEGVFDPSYYAYERNPALMTAKIETPILVTDAASGVPDGYILNAVDNDGINLARIFVSCLHDTDDASFVRGRAVTELGKGDTNHLMTKGEALELIRSQFPESTVSETMMITNLRLGDDPHSHSGLFWYFTVSKDARSLADTDDEYIIGAEITGYRSIPGGVSNRAAIDLGFGGSPHLDGYRMAKLDTPIHLFDTLSAARSAGGVSLSPAMTVREPIGFTPVPLK
jgi:hypothetical protein